MLLLAGGELTLAGFSLGAFAATDGLNAPLPIVGLLLVWRGLENTKEFWKV